MFSYPSWIERCRRLVLIVGIGSWFALPLLAQDSTPAEPAPTEQPQTQPQPEPEQQGPRSRFEFKDDDTSQNNTMLENILERYPDSDTNKDGILDAEEGRAYIAKLRERTPDRTDRGRGTPTATHKDVAYGPDAKHRIDLYLAKADKPTPLVLYFHDGQFITGDEDDTGTLDVRSLLSAGISVASIDYRTVGAKPFPGPFEDAAQAVQFLRLNASQYNLDPERFAGHGEEAGGNLALYLALHDDLAQPSPKPEEATPDEAPVAVDALKPWEDPKLKTMSTRLVCAVARHPIASFDPRSWAEHKLPMNGHERLMKRYLNVRYLEPLDDDEVIKLVEDVSPLALVSQGDPDVLLMSQYTDLELTENTVWTIMSHHPKQSQLIAQAMQAKGNQAIVRYRGMTGDPGTTSVQFFLERLK